jgi:hypothetical protein
MFYPGSGSEHTGISSRIRIRTLLIPNPKTFLSNLLFSCLWFQEQSLSHSHSQKDPGSGKNSSRIRMPDRGGKKADMEYCNNFKEKKCDYFNDCEIKFDVQKSTGSRIRNTMPGRLKYFFALQYP